MVTQDQALSDGQGLRQPPGENIDDILKSEAVQIGRKKFVLTLKRNRHGPFLRMSEESGGHHVTTIIPAEGIPDLLRVLSEMLCLTRNPGASRRNEDRPLAGRSAAKTP